MTRILLKVLTISFFLGLPTFSMAQAKLTREQRKTLKADKKARSGQGAPNTPTGGGGAKAPKKPFLERIGIVKSNANIPHFRESVGRQDKQTQKRMKKKYKEANRRMRKMRRR